MKNLMITLLITSALVLCSKGEARSYTFNQDRSVTLKGMVTPQTTTPVELKIKEYASFSDDPIYMLIDSPGGMTTPGLSLVDVMVAAQEVGVKFICLVDGQAASMAFTIYALCDERLAYPHSQLMWHKAYVQAGFSRLRVPDVSRIAVELIEVDKAAIDIYKKAFKKKYHKRIFRSYKRETVHLARSVADWLGITIVKRINHP